MQMQRPATGPAVAPTGGSRRAIEADCRRVLLSVFRDLDEFAYQRLVEQFTVDGRWRREGRELAGRAQIRAALEARPRNQVVRHLITNLIIDVESPSRARAGAYNTAFRALDTTTAALPVPITAPLGLWVLDGTLVCQADIWLIADLRQSQQFSFAA